MIWDVIDLIVEYIDGDLNKFVYILNDYVVVIELVIF